VVNAGPPARRSSGGGIRRRRSGGSTKRRRSRSTSSSGGTIGNRILKTAIGGFCYGQLIKNFPTLPTIPGFGRAGSVALGIYLLKPSSPILQDMGIAAAAIAGHSFGSTGVVAGDDDETLNG
jgi:hypothetical protein